MYSCFFGALSLGLSPKGWTASTALTSLKTGSHGPVRNKVSAMRHFTAIDEDSIFETSFNWIVSEVVPGSILKLTKDCGFTLIYKIAPNLIFGLKYNILQYF